MNTKLVQIPLVRPQEKESQLELLIIVANQIVSEYKDFEIILNKGIPEIIKVKPHEKVDNRCRYWIR